MTEVMHGIVNGRISGGQAYIQKHADDSHKSRGSEIKR